MENILGYAALPLYAHKRIIVDGSHGLPVFSKLEPNYLSRVEVDSRPLFHVRSELISTIYPQDLKINQFLNVFHTTPDEVPDEELVLILKDLQGLSHFISFMKII